jgi:hypothetical protein
MTARINKYPRSHRIAMKRKYLRTVSILHRQATALGAGGWGPADSELGA